MTRPEPKIIPSIRSAPKKHAKHDPLHMQEGLTHCWCMCGSCWEPLQAKCICINCSCRVERLTGKL